MKKFLTVFLSFSLCLILCLGLTGCISSYSPAEGPGNNNPGGNTTDTPNEEEPFTVVLVLEDEMFIPDSDVGVQWYDGESLYSAQFDKGVASVYGLDGDYRVTLTDIPRGYTYNPNIYYATNKNKDVQIELLPLLRATGQGTDWFTSAYNIIRAGTYGVTFTEAGQRVYCNFTPPERGVYEFESINDVTANEVNPRIEDYGQNPRWTPTLPYETCKDGGVSAAYTRNFKYQTNIDQDCLNFIIRCDSRVGYPATVYFTITYTDDYSRDPVYTIKVPEQLYNEAGEVISSPEAGGTYVKCGRESGNTSHILDASKFALGQDGYYHLKDADGNPTLSIVYADLSEFLGGRWITPEGGTEYYVPTNLKVGLYDYTFFIKGWSGLIQMYGSALNVPEKYAYLNGRGGYSDSAISNDRCAVTEELRQFLHEYCKERHLFFDGMGSAELAGYNSSDDDQWLYFCGYYVSN